MGALQNTGFGSGPIRRSKGGPGFKAAFAPGTERNLFTSAALAALGRQFLGADSPIANFALQSAQGGLESFTRKRERETQLAQQRALGLLPPEAPQFQGQFPGVLVGGGASPGFIPGQTPIPGLEPPGQIPGAIGGGGITPEFNPRFGLTPLPGAAGASLPATGPLSSFAQAQTGRRFAGAGRNFPSGGNAGVTLGLSPEIVARTAEGVSREVGASVRAQSVRERTRAIQEEGVATRESREGIAAATEAGKEERFKGERAAFEEKARLDNLSAVAKLEREEDKAFEDTAENFRKRIDSALTIDETTNPGVQAGTLQGIRTEILGNLRLMESKPGLLPAVEAQLTRLKSPFDVKLVTMIGPDGRQIAVRSEFTSLKQEQGFRVVGPTLSGAEPVDEFTPAQPFDSEVGLTPEEIETARLPALPLDDLVLDTTKAPATALRQALERKGKKARRTFKTQTARARELATLLRGIQHKSSTALRDAKHAEKFDLDLQARFVAGEDFELIQTAQFERWQEELDAIDDRFKPSVTPETSLLNFLPPLPTSGFPGTPGGF